MRADRLRGPFFIVRDGNTFLIGSELRLCSTLYSGLVFRANLDALILKIFRAKYYPRRNFLNAIVGKSPCYAW